MAERFSGVKASVGFASEAGLRKANEDFGGAVFGWELTPPRHDVIAAVADGIGGAKGGRIAAETGSESRLPENFRRLQMAAIRRRVEGAIRGEREIQHPIQRRVSSS